MIILVNKTIECERYFKPSKVMKGTEQKNQDSKSKATMAKLWRLHHFLCVSGKSLCSSLLSPFRQKGSTCWGWKEESRILHFSCHLWKIWTCPTNAFLCLSLSKSLSCAMCCPRRRLRRQRQKVPRRTGHSPYRWTVKYVMKIQSFH